MIGSLEQRLLSNMDLDEVKACIRALLSSTAFSYNLNSLLNDFKNVTGVDLPLFGYSHPAEFLSTLDDTVQLFGNSYNPEIALVESKKSAHITSLVERQKSNHLKTRYPHIATKHRIILPDRRKIKPNLKEDACLCSDTPSPRNYGGKKPLGRGKESKKELNSLPLKTSTSTDYSTRPKVITNLTEVKVGSVAEFGANNYSNYMRGSGSSDQRQKDFRVQISSFGSLDIDKTDSCYFEDVSDHESSVSITESRSSSGQAASAPCSFVNDGIKKKLKKLIKNYPKGLWCCELPELFLAKFNFVLDYREFGYTSLIQMLSELPDVFRCIRPGNEDWILFDASVPPSSEEKKMINLQFISDINCQVRANVQKLLFKYLETSSDSGIEMHKILDLYQEMFGSHLDFQSLGFRDIKSLLETWEGSFLNLLRINGKIFVVPASKITIHSPKSWKEAVPPINAESDIFAEIFPKEVIGPDEGLAELNLSRHLAVGHVIEVCIAEVWSPSKFYLQLNKFKNRLNRFMDDLQKFYNVHLRKYKMPESTIRPNQVCVGLYTSDPDFPDEWHRAQIIKVINEKLVLINFVDFGTVTRVRKSQLRFLHRDFQSFPIQAFLAELYGVVPPNSEKKWPVSTSKKFLELLRVPYLEAKVIDIDFEKPAMSVILFDPFQKSVINLNKKLILEKLAWAKEPAFEGGYLLSEWISKDKAEDSKVPKNLTKTFSDNSRDVAIKENLSKSVPELTDEFSDISDLSQTTLFQFKMRCLKLEESLHSNKKNESDNASENLKILYEFEEIPDLEKNTEEEEGDKLKKTTKDDIWDENKNSELASSLRDKKQNPSLLTITEEPNLSFHLPNMTVPEQTFLPLLGRSKRLPPGLEHVNILPNFNEIQFFMQPEDRRKKINILAIELLTTNLSIKQVGVNDPMLALKIATEMAEAYVNSEYSCKTPCCNAQMENSFGNDLFQNVSLGRRPALPVIPSFPLNSPETMPESPETTNLVTYTADINSPQASSSSKAISEVETAKEKKENEYVKNVQICGKNMHLLIIDQQYYFCAEEVVRNFTLISNREVADRVLHIKKIYIDYRIITKKTDEKALNAIKSSDLPTAKRKSKKLKIYLLPLLKVVPFLQALGCKTNSFENTFLELLQDSEKKAANLKMTELS